MVGGRHNRCSAAAAAAANPYTLTANIVAVVLLNFADKVLLQRQLDN